MQEHVRIARPLAAVDEWMAGDEVLDQLSEIVACRNAGKGWRTDDITSVKSCEVNDDFAVLLATKHKPRIAFVGHAAVRFDLHSGLHEGVFDPIKFRQLLLRPVKTPWPREWKKRQNLRGHSKPHCAHHSCERRVISGQQ